MQLRVHVTADDLEQIAPSDLFRVVGRGPVSNFGGGAQLILESVNVNAAYALLDSALTTRNDATQSAHTRSAAGIESISITQTIAHLTGRDTSTIHQESLQRLRARREQAAAREGE